MRQRGGEWRVKNTIPEEGPGTREKLFLSKNREESNVARAKKAQVQEGTEGSSPVERACTPWERFCSLCSGPWEGITGCEQGNTFSGQ